MYVNNKDEILQIDLSSFIAGVYDTNPATRYECVRKFRIALSKLNEPPIKQVIDSGVAPKFIQLSQDHNYPQLQSLSFIICDNIFPSSPK